MEEQKEIWGRVWSSVLLLPAAHSISRGSAATALLRGRGSTAAGWGEPARVGKDPCRRLLSHCPDPRACSCLDARPRKPTSSHQPFRLPRAVGPVPARLAATWFRAPLPLPCYKPETTRAAPLL